MNRLSWLKRTAEELTETVNDRLLAKTKIPRLSREDVLVTCRNMYRLGRCSDT